MDKNEKKQERANMLYNLARLAGVCKTQKDFANFLGINEQSVCKALKGEENYLTNNFFTRIENAFNEAGISMNTAVITAPVNIQQGDGNNNEQTQETTETPPQLSIDRLLDEMQAQREMHDRMMSELLKQNSQLINIITNSKN